MAKSKQAMDVKLNQSDLEYLEQVTTLLDEYGRSPTGRSKPQGQMLVARLRPGGFLPDRGDDPDEFGRLVQDIRENGVHTPILVQVPPENRQPELYPIIAGERRWRAAKEAGLKWVPCTFFAVEHEEACSLALSENMNRRNMTALEEARAIADMRRDGAEWAEIGRRLGLTPAMAARKGQLVHLIDDIAEAVSDPKNDWSREPLRVLEYVASLPPETQAELPEYPNWPAGTAKEVIERIQANYLFQLDRARWDLEDEELDREAGPCSKCPHRSDRAELLFDDLPGEARCLQPACFQRKAKAYIREVIRQCLDRGHKPILVTAQYGMEERFGELDVDGTTYRPVIEWSGKRVQSGKAPGAKRAIYVDKGGTLGWFVPGKTATTGTKTERRPKPLPASEDRERKRKQMVLRAVADALVRHESYPKLFLEVALRLYAVSRDLGELDAPSCDDRLGKMFLEDCGHELGSRISIHSRRDARLDDHYALAQQVAETFFADETAFSRMVQEARLKIPEPSGQRASPKAGKKAAKAKKRKAAKRKKKAR